MRGEDGAGKRAYLYRKCPECGVKLRVDAKECFKCGSPYWLDCLTGKRAEIIYGSENPNDAIYSAPMNSGENCMKCRNVTIHGKICKTAFCYGTGKGNCGACRRYENTRFDCCQAYQEYYGVISPGDWEAVKEKMTATAKKKNAVPA